MRSLRDWFDGYGESHRHPVNQAIHWVCVPVITWCVIALLWLIPVPSEIMLRPGTWATLAMFLTFLFYNRLSRNLSWAMALAFIAMALVTSGLYRLLGPTTLLWLAVALFVLAWIAQFIGHQIEGRRPAFFTDLAFLVISPAWLMGKVMRRLRISW